MPPTQAQHLEQILQISNAKALGNNSPDSDKLQPSVNLCGSSKALCWENMWAAVTLARNHMDKNAGTYVPRTHVATRVWQPNDKYNISTLGELGGRGLAALTSHQQSQDLCARRPPSLRRTR